MRKYSLHSSVCRYYPYNSERDWNKAKREAARQVTLALSRKVLLHQPCVVCGGKAEAHHEDYEKPLAVTWLCRKHHRDRHAEIRAGIAAKLSSVEIEPLHVRVHRRFLHDPVLKRTIVHNATLAVVLMMQKQGVSESELARRIGSSRQHVNQMIHGGIRNLAALSKVASALDCDLDVRLVAKKAKAA